MVLCGVLPRLYSVDILQEATSEPCSSSRLVVSFPGGFRSDRSFPHVPRIARLERARQLCWLHSQSIVPGRRDVQCMHHLPQKEGIQVVCGSITHLSLTRRSLGQVRPDGPPSMFQLHQGRRRMPVRQHPNGHCGLRIHHTPLTTMIAGRTNENENDIQIACRLGTVTASWARPSLERHVHTALQHRRRRPLHLCQ